MYSAAPTSDPINKTNLLGRDILWPGGINSVCCVGDNHSRKCLGFAIVGAGAMWLRKDLRRYLTLLLGMIFSVAYSFFFGKIRYRLPVEPYIIILSAYGIKTTWATLAAHSVRSSYSAVEGIEKRIESKQDVFL